MNYYNRHIGDYAKQTAHLSFPEDGAYNRMLDYYYASEHPLPLDRELLYRKVRAKSTTERKMVDRLLHEFFKETEHGWRKNRCDEEIEKYQHKVNANRKNGTQGGRPKKPNGNPTETHWVSKQNPNKTLTKNQEPRTNSQETKSTSTTVAESADAPPAGDAAKGAKKNGRKALSDGPVVIAIPLVGNAEYEVHQSFVDELERLYPAVDVQQTLREIRGWNLSRPSQRKTAGGVLRHINTWMAKEQNKG